MSTRDEMGEICDNGKTRLIEELNEKSVTVVYTLGGYVQSISGILKDRDEDFLLVEVDGKAIYLALDKVVSIEIPQEVKNEERG